VIEQHVITQVLGLGGWVTDCARDRQEEKRSTHSSPAAITDTSQNSPAANGRTT
jgi:hypothetical protein